MGSPEVVSGAAVVSAAAVVVSAAAAVVSTAAAVVCVDAFLQPIPSVKIRLNAAITAAIFMKVLSGQ